MLWEDEEQLGPLQQLEAPHLLRFERPAVVQAQPASLTLARPLVHRGGGLGDGVRFLGGRPWTWELAFVS